jgi:hypothetical protein
MLEAAETIPSGEIKAYRDFVGISFTLGYNTASQSLRPLHPLSGIPLVIPFSQWKMQVLGSHPRDTSSILSTMTPTSPISSAQGAETSGGIRSINMGTRIQEQKY